MSKLEWDLTGERLYETGVKNTVLYPQVSGAYPQGFAWSGVTAINENPSGGEATDLYADDIKYLSIMSAETLGLGIEAYMYPPEFEACDGTKELVAGVVVRQQARQAFGLAYTTTLGNDTESNDYGYKIHLVYGCMASPTTRDYATINDSPEAITFSWDVTTTPVSVPGFKASSEIVIDSTKVSAAQLAAVEEVLYGTDDAEAYLPLPKELIELLENAASSVSSTSYTSDETVGV